MKFGIIGPGNIARKFADAVRRLDGVEIVAVSSHDRSKAKKFAREFGISKVYTDEKELVSDPEVGAVYISQINILHVKTALLCLEHYKPVICEKPLAMTAGEAEYVLSSAERRHVLFMEGMWTLHLPVVRQVKKWVSEGRIGTVKYMDADFTFYAPYENERLYTPKLGGGAVLDVGIYPIAFSLYIAGEFVKTRKSSVYVGPTGVVEMGASLLQFTNGMVANCSFGIQGNADNSAHIYGSEGRIVMPEFWSGHKATLYDLKGDIVDEVADPEPNGFIYEIRDFVDAYEKGLTEVSPTDHHMTRMCAKLMDGTRWDGGIEASVRTD